jgi:N-acetylneuraminic acid mutarotase
VRELLVAVPVSTILIILLIPLITSPAMAQSWSEGATMPTPRSEITATNIGDDIYVIGGLDKSEDVLDVVEVYNVKNNSWKSAASLPQPLHHTAATSYDGKIYVVGGFISREWIPTNQLFIYEPTKNQWTEGNPMPTPRGALNALFVNGTLYAIGGQDNARISNMNEAYDPLTNKWISKPSMPTGRDHAASATIDNKIYVSGGRLAGSSPYVNVNVNEIYDTETEKWTAVEPMQSKRSGIAAAAINNSFFVFGGEDTIKTYGNNEEYSTQDGKWISQEPMPTSRHGLAAVSVDDRIFVIGGAPRAGFGVSHVNEIYTKKPWGSAQSQEINLIDDKHTWKPFFDTNLTQNQSYLHIVVATTHKDKIHSRAFLPIQINSTMNKYPILNLEYASQSTKGNATFMAEIRDNSSEVTDNSSSNILWYNSLNNTNGRLSNETHTIPSNIVNRPVELRLYAITNGPGEHILTVKKASIMIH